MKNGRKRMKIEVTNHIDYTSFMYSFFFSFISNFIQNIKNVKFVLQKSSAEVKIKRNILSYSLFCQTSKFNYIKSLEKVEKVIISISVSLTYIHTFMYICPMLYVCMKRMRDIFNPKKKKEKLGIYVFCCMHT